MFARGKFAQRSGTHFHANKLSLAWGAERCAVHGGLRAHNYCTALRNARLTFARSSRWGTRTRSARPEPTGDVHAHSRCTALGNAASRRSRAGRAVRSDRSGTAARGSKTPRSHREILHGEKSHERSRASCTRPARRPSRSAACGRARPSHPSTARAPRPAPSLLKGPRPPPRFLPRGPPPRSPRSSGPWYAPRGGGGGRRGSRERAGGARPGRPPRLQAAGPGPLPCGLGDAGAAFPGWMRPPAAGRGVTPCGLPACARRAARLAPPARAAEPRTAALSGAVSPGAVSAAAAGGFAPLGPSPAR